MPEKEIENPWIVGVTHRYDWEGKTKKLPKLQKKVNKLTRKNKVIRRK